MPTVSSQSEASKATTAVLLLSLPNIFILIAFSYYELLRSNTQHSTTIVFSLLSSSSSSSYTMIKLQVLVDKDPGLTGNLLVERLVGAHVDLISKEEYAKLGSVVCLFCSNAFHFTAMRFLLCCYYFLHLNFKNLLEFIPKVKSSPVPLEFIPSS